MNPIAFFAGLLKGNPRDPVDALLGTTPPPPTQHQLNVQARVVAYLKEWGGVDVNTVNKMGTTCGHKLISRLRKQGYLHPANDPRGYVSLPNASGQGSYRWHRWTGKQ